MSLTTYNKKRNFGKTSEPAGKKRASEKKLSFVVQRHDASHLHYDFRLELDGVLKSWAIPKGPSLNPSDKRLAVMVEDHPVSYGKFEGDIPKGNYGAGRVDIWDKGTYEAENTNGNNNASQIREGLREGSLKFRMNGNRLKGSFALVRLKDGKDKNWLLIKHRDEFTEDDYQIEKLPSTKKTTAKSTVSKDQRNVLASVRSKGKKLSTFIKPMLAKVSDGPFDDDEWIFEVKWDGYRAITEVQRKEIKFYSRNGLSFLELYPEVAEELKKIGQDVILDGEVVALDREGKPSFQKLQRFGEDRSAPIVYYVFDCLSYRGKDMTGHSLLERKALAKKVLPKSGIIQYSDHVVGTGKAFFMEIVKMGGLEGMIAKRADSTYTKGRRSDSWLKVKNQNTTEAVIAGYTDPRASRKYFGALILGMYEKKKLKYIGHTGTGFTDKLLKELHEVFQSLVTDDSPFDRKVPVNAAVTWLNPTLVCNVKYTELTNDGIMRHPVFMGLRVDRAPKEVDHMDSEIKKTKAHNLKGKAPTKKPEKTEGMSSGDTMMKVGGHSLKFTNLDKVFWPEEGFTKGDVINYYNGVADYILPYLKDRPQSLKRNPNGITDKGFFHKDAGAAAPDWVKSVKVHSEHGNKDIDYILCNNKATLLYLNNLGCIEINPWNSRIKKPDHPDYLIMDIDPSDENTFDQVVDVALVIKEILDKARVSSYCKTSGATGLHIYIPVKGAYTYEQAKPFTELVAVLANEQLPGSTTVERPLAKRKGRIYIDFLQNRRGQTLSSAYSLRPVPGASVSTPLHWKEVKHGLSPLDFTLWNVPQRLAKTGDLFAGVLKDKNNIRKSLAALEI